MKNLIQIPQSLNEQLAQNKTREKKKKPVTVNPFMNARDAQAKQFNAFLYSY